MKRLSAKHIVWMALFIALEIILSRFLSFNVWNMKIGFNFIPVVIAAIILGPAAGGIVGAAGDFLGAILFPIGAYFPGFTLTAFLTGVVWGIFLHKKRTNKRLFFAVLINQLLLSLLLNSIWISVLYGTPFLPLLYARIVQCAILGPIQFIVIKIISPIIVKQGRQLFFDASGRKDG